MGNLHPKFDLSHNSLLSHFGQQQHQQQQQNSSSSGEETGSYHPRQQHPDPLTINPSSQQQTVHTSRSPAGVVLNGGSSTSPPSIQRQHPIDLGLVDPSLITHFLLLGGAMVNKNPELVAYLGITHVVNMAVELPPSYELLAANRALVYKHIRSDDSLR